MSFKVLFILFAALLAIGFSAQSQPISCKTILVDKILFQTNFGIEEYQFSDRLSVQHEAEVAVSVARVASILPQEKFKELQSASRDYRDLATSFHNEVFSFSKTLLKNDNPYALVQQLNPIEAVSTIETALKNRGAGLSSVSAISLYQVLKNPDAAKESFRNLMLRLSPYFLSKQALETQFRHLETNVELSGVLATLTGLGTASYFVGGGDGVAGALLFAAVAYGSGKAAHALIKEFPYGVITKPIDTLRRRWLRRSLQRSLNQFLIDETDSVRLQLFDYRFKKWRSTIENNRKQGLSADKIANNLYETSMLLALDFPLLTFPIKLAEVDFKNLKSKQYSQLVEKFKKTVETRRIYLEEVVKVLKESSEAQKALNQNQTDTSALQTYLNQTAVSNLILGIESAEFILERTLQESVTYDRQLQILVESLQLADQKVESTMLTPLPAK